MSEDTRTPLELTPLEVGVSSQQFDLPNFLKMVGPIDSLNPFNTKILPPELERITDEIWDFSTSLKKQEEVYRAMGEVASGSRLFERLGVDDSVVDFLESVADTMENVRTLGPYYWTVPFLEFRDGSVEWVDVQIRRDIVTEYDCGQGFCVVPNNRVGTDWVNLSLNSALFPEWRLVYREAESARPSFTSLTKSIDVRPIQIELIPRRMIGKKPGDLVRFVFIVKHADTPEVEWNLSEGTFAAQNLFQHEGTYLFSTPAADPASSWTAAEPYEGSHYGELFIEVPAEDTFVFPLSIRGETIHTTPWMDPNRDRSTTGYVDGDRSFIVPKVACLKEGQQISLKLYGGYQEDHQVSWSVSAGSIEALDDEDSGVDRAIYTAPDSEEEIVISATVTGRSVDGERLESTAEVTYSMDCKCWWTAEFEGGARGTMGGYKATVGRGLFQQIMGSHTVSLTDENSEDGLMLGFPGQDNLVGNSLDASLHIFAEREDLLGGSLIEADMVRAYGLDLPKEIFFSGYHEPFYSGRFTGRTLTMVEVLLHQVWQREPIPTTVTATFFADSQNDCKTRRWFN